jgi:hypothetical protein
MTFFPGMMAAGGLLIVLMSVGIQFTPAAVSWSAFIKGGLFFLVLIAGMTVVCAVAIWLFPLSRR